MKKIVIACILLGIVMICVVCFVLAKEADHAITQDKNDDYPYTDEATVILNGVPVSFSGVYFYQLGKEDCVHVPFMRFLDAIGYEIKAVDEDSACVCITGKDYIFSKSTGSFVEKGSDQNVLIPYHGRDGYNIDVEEADSYLEVKTIMETLNSLGEKITIKVSFEERTIIVET